MGRQPERAPDIDDPQRQAAPLEIPFEKVISPLQGFVSSQAELEANSISLKALSKISDRLTQGRMCFEGSGAGFVAAFRDRIHHILEANGAFFDGKKNRGHAQKNQNISFNTIQPYPDGKLQGLYPAIVIQP